MNVSERLEYLRAELRAGRLSYGELYELQGLADQIDPGDVELLEAAGVPEFPESAATCPGCGGPITFTADDSDGVTVDFHCPNTECGWGKHS